MTTETAWSIERETFDPPSGNVRGVIVGYIGEGKTRRRVAHAYILTNGSDISVFSLRKATTEDVLGFSALLVSFAEIVANSVEE